MTRAKTEEVPGIVFQVIPYSFFLFVCYVAYARYFMHAVKYELSQFKMNESPNKEF